MKSFKNTRKKQSRRVKNTRKKQSRRVKKQSRRVKNQSRRVKKQSRRVKQMRKKYKRGAGFFSSWKTKERSPVSNTDQVSVPYRDGEEAMREADMREALKHIPPYYPNPGNVNNDNAAAYRAERERAAAHQEREREKWLYKLLEEYKRTGILQELNNGRNYSKATLEWILGNLDNSSSPKWIYDRLETGNFDTGTWEPRLP
jgi:type I site-specific restriction endonuclease